MTRWPARLGRPGLAAVLAGAAALPLAGWLTPQWQARAAARAEAVRQTPLATPSPAAPEAMPALPQVGDPAERVADLLALALRHGVRVDRTQQQLQRQGPVLRLQLSLSAHGRYADLRAFVAAALLADPGLALDTLQWRRANAGATELDADLQWSVLQPLPAEPRT